MLLTQKQIQEIYQLSRMTLLKWEKEGIICPVRTPRGTRRYRKHEIDETFGLVEKASKQQYEVILYARVSTKKQARYLENQIQRLEKYAKSKKYSYEVISEISSGVNEKRRGLKKLLNCQSKTKMS